MSFRLFRGALLTLFGFIAGCADGITEIVLEYRSDLELDTVEIMIARGADMEQQTVNISEHPFPFTQVLVHRAGVLGPITIQAVGKLRGEEVVETSFGTQFVPNQTITLVVDLTSACRDVQCSDTELCVAGECQSTIRIDAGVRDAAPFDAGRSDTMTMDAPPMDANRLDASRPDVGRPDGGVTDAGCVMNERAVTGDYQCEADCSCTIQCRVGADCAVTCAAGATCVVECGRDSNCQVIGEANTDLSLSCDQSESCTLQAGAASTVDYVCDNANCDADCVAATSCEVSYMHPNAEGTVQCGESMCSIASCFSQEDCGDGTLVCNRTCS